MHRKIILILTKKSGEINRPFPYYHNIHASDIPRSIPDDLRGLLQGGQSISAIEAANEVEDLLRPDPPLLMDLHPPEFAVEDEDHAPIKEGHVIFNEDISVLKGASGVDNKKRGPGKLETIVFPDGADVSIDLPVLSGVLPCASPPVSLIFFAILGNASEPVQVVCRIERLLGSNDEKSAHIPWIANWGLGIADCGF